MPHVPGLRSCYDKTGRLVYFGRMLDKIRLHAAGKLPPEYVANLGDGKINQFDGRMCRFLGVRYEDLKSRTLPAPATRKSSHGPRPTARRTPTRSVTSGTASS